ncbi:MAG: hypothetical protein V1927_01675 [Candidatus Omnitrophota bacterium]
MVYFIIEEELNLTKGKAIFPEEGWRGVSNRKDRPIKAGRQKPILGGAIERFRPVFECFFRKG